MNPITRLWWMLSVPYSLGFLCLVGILRAFGAFGGFAHSGLIVPFLVVAILTSLSSGAWLLFMVYRSVIRRTENVGRSKIVMMALSAVPFVWCVVYLAGG